MADTDTDTDSNDGGGLFGNTPITWVVIPIIVLFIIAAALTLTMIRRRKRQNMLYRTGGWPSRGLAPHGYYSGGSHVHHHSRSGGAFGGRWAPWGGTRSQDGLNELGEAPPPYQGGKAMEEGVRLPDYPAGPAPAVTTESRRH